MRTLKTRMFLLAGALLAVALTGGDPARAQTCSVSWTNNTGDGLWSTAGNRSTNQVPGPSDDVCILTTSGNGSFGAGCVDATGVPSISIHSLLVNGDGLEASWSAPYRDTMMVSRPSVLAGAFVVL